MELEVAIRPRRRSRAICSGCGRKRPGYDRLPARRCQFVPLWGIAVFFTYALRRVNCPRCGIKVEQVPWAAREGVVDDDISVVPGAVGETTVVAGSGDGVSDELEHGVSGGDAGGAVGHRQPVAGRD